MTRVYYVFSIALLMFACANSKSVEESTAETKLNSPSAVPAEPSVAPNGALHETIDGGAITDAQIAASSIEWLDFETAIDRNSKNPKYIFIDIYTEWCGWCKKMDGSTFKDPAVVKFINENCYAVKMDAEMKESIAYNGKLYEYRKVSERSGYNTLAMGLLDNQMSFPSFVILDKKEAKRGKIMGYKTPQPFLAALQNYVK
ncbi:MAG: thioredoxin family protein [Crocinitomicaceae bacterium]